MQGELKNKQKNKQKKRWFKWPGMSHGWAGLNIIETDDFPASIVYREPSEKEKNINWVSIPCWCQKSEENGKTALRW